ncbi:hypothetical protein [Amycolatopsis sp. lyj-90]|uniref:hypothetical protein n=1 Tax=Amycolatopsis sp. lyj-90 TaxID=2789285 RepID=UPI00397C72E6
MDQLTLGVISRSRKENEWRLPIHPRHLERIAPELRKRIYLEHGYGERFGIPDEDLVLLVAGLRSREWLIAECDIILLAKPLADDLAELRPGQILWGWPHCVQDDKLTQLAIDRKLTLVAFEAMNHWRGDGSFGLHVFHKNNELAGYCSVLHALQLIGSTGDYGRRLRAVVIGFGATARGSVTALNAHGIHDVHVLTPPRRDRGRFADPFREHRAPRPRPERACRSPPQPRHHRDRPRTAVGLPRGARHRRQLRAAGPQGPVDVPEGRGSHRVQARKSRRRRFL